MIKDNMDTTQCYIDIHQLGDKFYATYCIHGINPYDNCNKCCKYCGIPFNISQISEEDYEISCFNCGYDVS